MLINIFGKYQNGHLQFDLPPLYFERNSQVCVHQVFIIWNTKNKYNSLFLSSSLVEKSPANPLQQLLFIYPKKTLSNYTYASPTHKNYYKIQCQDLESSVFKISDLEKSFDDSLIKTVFIQLEIIDARIQSST